MKELTWANYTGLMSIIESDYDRHTLHGLKLYFAKADRFEDCILIDRYLRDSLIVGSGGLLLCDDQQYLDNIQKAADFWDKMAIKCVDEINKI